MNIRYGLQRMALLNSAGYDSAIIPLDASVGLLASNNAGKTSMVNALQFPLVPDRRRLSFGGHSIEDSRRFYFKHDSSYILVELLTAGGTVVVGCVGLGAGHDFVHFAYSGALDLEDYRTDDHKVVRQASLVQHMATRGHTVFRYKPDEFRDRLFCRNRLPQAGEPDFGLFRVRADQETDTFQTIFTRILRLDDLTSESIKRDMLELYRSDMRGNFNFRKEWEQAFAQVNADMAQLQAAISCTKQIEELADLREDRVRYRSQVLHQMKRIDVALEGWEKHQFERTQLLQGEHVVLSRQRGELDQRQVQAIEDRTLARAKLADQQGRAAECADLGELFMSQELATREGLAAAVEEIASRKHELSRQIRVATRTPVEVLERRHREMKSKLDDLRRQHAAAGATLHASLEQALTPEQLGGISRVLSGQVLSMGADRFEVDADAAARGVTVEEDGLHIAGMRLDISGLAAQYERRSPQELEEEIKLQQGQLEELADTLQAARDQQARQNQLLDLEEEEKQARARLHRFERWQELLTEEPERAAAIEALTNQIAELDVQIDSVGDQAQQLREAMDKIQRELERLEEDNRRIRQLQEKRLERSSRLLANMEHKPTSPIYTAGLPDVIPFEQLRSTMDQQHQLCQDLERAERVTSDLLAEIHHKGLTKFAGEGGPEQEIVRIIEYHENRANEEAAVASQSRAASAAVSSALAHLRDGLRSFQGRVSSFNRLITRRSISDLAVFRINVVPEQQLLDDIETVLAGIETSDTGQLSLMEANTRRSNDAVGRALANLLGQHELRVESLFALEFEVGKKGQEPQRHRSLKGAASDGTTAMAKLVIGLAMLSELRDPRHEVRAAAYLDEAARLDEANQRSLIAAAESFGFSLIMAAPSQLVTPAYCVPIDKVGNNSRIEETRWMQIVHRDEAAAATA